MRIAVVILVLPLVACDDLSSPTTPTSAPAATPARITFQVAPAHGVLFTGSTAQISVRVTDANGTNATGLRVQFATTAGTIDPPEAMIDSAGFASARLTAAEPATVRVSAGALAAELAVGAVAPFTVRVSGPSIAPLSAAVYTVSVDTNTGIVAPPQPSGVTAQCGSDSERALSPTGGLITCDFRSAGTHQVMAKAFGANGWAATERKEVTAGQGGEIPTTLALTTTLVSGGAGTGFAEWRIAATPGYANYEWSFGDGAAFSNDRSTEQHVYRAAGANTVTVKATPVGGGPPLTATTTITVAL
jgi:hypothetical protein